ncbi:hypothetical protein AB6A40_007865 [Gnathostoma spinigerum]|uniref:Uncharacterized protein n=1 Tax=Gnathostoma spinigerum TaxID=75299 RepID=A0ABD6EN00_9BILA
MCLRKRTLQNYHILRKISLKKVGEPVILLLNSNIRHFDDDKLKGTIMVEWMAYKHNKGISVRTRYGFTNALLTLSKQYENKTLSMTEKEASNVAVNAVTVKNRDRRRLMEVVNEDQR